MATMYELLSARRTNVPGQTGTFAADWEQEDIKSREYALPVRRNQRNKIKRTVKKKAPPEAEIIEENAIEENGKGSCMWICLRSLRNYSKNIVQEYLKNI